MAIEIEWLVSSTASALHAARAIAAGRPLVDSKLAEAIEPAVRDLMGGLTAAGMPAEKFFEQAIPAASRFDTPGALADAIAAKTLSPSAADSVAPAIARRLNALLLAFAQVCPDAISELELRGVPLREQWEARGPGLIATFLRITEPELLVESAQVVLVLPALGGGGSAHPQYNSVTLEAVLANPLAELPEIVRLGWLLSQLTFDMPRYLDRLPSDRLASVGPLAMIPPTLAAAEEVELARLNAGTLSTALSTWDVPAVEPSTLLDWWETYQASRPDWIVAVGALAEMLSGNDT